VFEEPAGATAAPSPATGEDHVQWAVWAQEEGFLTSDELVALLAAEPGTRSRVVQTLAGPCASESLNAEVVAQVVRATMAFVGGMDTDAGAPAGKRPKAAEARPELAADEDRLSQPVVSRLVQANAWWPESLAAKLREGKYVPYLLAALALSRVHDRLTAAGLGHVVLSNGRLSISEENDEGVLATGGSGSSGGGGVGGTGQLSFECYLTMAQKHLTANCCASETAMRAHVARVVELHCRFWGSVPFGSLCTTRRCG